MPKTPAPGPAPTPPADPAANDQAKAAAAQAKANSTRRNKSGSVNGTLATGPEEVLGAAPINKPELKSALG